LLKKPISDGFPIMFSYIQLNSLGEIKINKNIKLAVKEEVDWSIKSGI
jgi:hypothetical protein